MYRAHAWLLPGKSYKAVCRLHVPYRLRLLLDMKPCGDASVRQTLCQALGRTVVFLEEPALHLGNLGGTSSKSYRGWKREVNVDWAFKSSQNDGGERSRKQVLLQMPNLEKKAWDKCQGHRMMISQ